MQSTTIQSKLEFFGRPGQQDYWSDPNNLVDFLYIQSYYHNVGSSPHISKASIILMECADKLIEIFNLEEQNDLRQAHERFDRNLSAGLDSSEPRRQEEPPEEGSRDL